VQVSKYDTEIDLSNPNTSHAQLVDLVGGSRTVLDVGCSTGYLARVLRERGCTVSGVEYDAQAAEAARPHLERLVVGDLEQLDLATAFDGEQFEVIVFGDVLEHLRDPLAALRAVLPVLAPDGSVVASIPNIAHASVRLSLLKGRFDYQPLGLLDNTHIRFFTRQSVQDLFWDAGLVVTEVRRTTAGPFETELKLRTEDFDSRLVEDVLADDDALTYQFVVKATRDTAEGALARMRAKHTELEGEVRTLQHKVHELEVSLRDAEQRFHDTLSVAEQRAAELTQVHAELTAVYERQAAQRGLMRQAADRLRGRR
jgi:2-polyprenyl-3-methyl-5-hydroxy-6-metoxy-1,4-benzoquinol methylase